MNEHFDANWRPLPDYNIVEPAHQFRPYGGTIGHWFEWARLAYTLDAGRFEADARRLFAAGVRDGWDGSGFVYTVDWDGKPVVADRLWWVLCEAIGAAAVLGEDALQAEWWDLAEQRFIDREHGSWIHELDPSNRPSSTVWNGKPDIYHSLQATLIPRFPLAPRWPQACGPVHRRRRERRGGHHERERGEPDAERDRVVRQRLLKDDRAGGDRDDVRGRARDRDHGHRGADLQRARGDEQPDQAERDDHECERMHDDRGAEVLGLPAQRLDRDVAAGPEEAGGTASAGPLRARAASTTAAIVAAATTV